jgi:hypothetical protein
LAGFKTEGKIDYPGLPIFLPNEKSLKNSLPWRVIGHTPVFSSINLIVPVLYELNYRGIDYRQTKNQPNRFIALYDNNEELFNEKNLKPMELKYPGLFQRMFVTEEEEQNALEELQRKEVSLIRRIPQNFKPKIIIPVEDENEKSQEDKEKTYREEMEITRQMMPYFRDEIKEKRKNKNSRKNVEDTNVTIGRL